MKNYLVKQMKTADNKHKWQIQSIHKFSNFVVYWTITQTHIRYNTQKHTNRDDKYDGCGVDVERIRTQCDAGVVKMSGILRVQLHDDMKHMTQNTYRTNVEYFQWNGFFFGSGFGGRTKHACGNEPDGNGLLV